MKPMDLSGLIKGLMIVIGIALALGKLDELKRWAVHEASPLLGTKSIGSELYYRNHGEHHRSDEKKSGDARERPLASLPPYPKCAQQPGVKRNTGRTLGEKKSNQAACD